MLAVIDCLTCEERRERCDAIRWNRNCVECGSTSTHAFVVAEELATLDLNELLEDDATAFDALAMILDLDARADDERDPIVGRDEHADTIVRGADVVTMLVRPLLSEAA